MRNSKSLYALVLSAITMLYCSYVFYPRWQKDMSEATISWDVAGYYWPLPAAFIYSDFVQQGFADSIIHKYKPSGNEQVAVKIEGKGKYIYRYTFGTTILYLPFFTIAHLAAEPLGYPADGFSRPYQFAIQSGALLFAFLGLWHFRKLFLKFYSDKVVATLILILCIGSNYLNYAAIDNALSHSWLFTLYVFLILNSISFNNSPNYKYAIRIGLLVGLMTLMRPTEVICCIIPLLWGMNSISIAAIKDRLQFLLGQWKPIFLAGIIASLIIFIQPLYWKLVAGHWIMDTYAGQGFSFDDPYFLEYIFSYRSGWLIYTPILVFAFIGLITFIRYGNSKVAIITFFFINLYIVASWDQWWYAGTGGRAMIQSYPMLFFPIASLVAYVWERVALKWIFIALSLAFTYHNIWFTYNAHAGDGLYDSEGMNKEYFWRVAGRWTAPEETHKLKECGELFEGKPKNMKLIYSNNFENDTTLQKSEKVLEGNNSYTMDADHRSSGFIKFALPPHDAKWLRASATYHCKEREWNRYKWSQLMVRFYRKNEVIKEKMIYVDRYLNENRSKEIYIDVQIPESPVDSAGVSFWGENIVKPIYIDDLKVWIFDE